MSNGALDMIEATISGNTTVGDQAQGGGVFVAGRATFTNGWLILLLRSTF